MRRVVCALVATVSMAGGLVAGVLSAPQAGAVVPAGFVDELVTGVPGPTALAFAPDGRMLITTQGGTVRVVSGGALLPTPALNLAASICTNSERGLLGVAVDPAFATNGFVFLYYSFNKAGDCGTGTVNRVSRFVMTGNTLGGEVVIIDNVPSPAGNHNAGDVHFGKDGMLYVSVGDGGCDYPGGTPSGCAGANDAARDRNELVGKVLRIDRNGGIPSDNPFTGPGTAPCRNDGVTAGLICQETFAWGLRNPFRIAFDPNAAGTRFYVNDVGQATWEEIDLGTSGADYGWNVREGHCAQGSTTDCGPPPAGMTNPIFDYGRSDGCNSITGGAFVPNGVWPAEFQGKYLFADFVCGRIFRLDPNGAGGFNRVDFATGLGGGSAVHLRFGPWGATQALYYTTYAGGGQIRRISSTAHVPVKTDISVYRPSTGAWYVHGGTNAFWGATGDVPVPADYDGNGTNDVAVYRPSNGAWYVLGGTNAVWGTPGDIPVPADYNGDGRADFAVYRPSTGAWYVAGAGGAVWGTPGDIPVPADYNGDGRADFAVYRPSNGAWYVAGYQNLIWGASGDIPVPGDYNGDGRAEVAVYRPSNGAWYVLGGSGAFWGTPGDVPQPGDYNADGRTEFAVYRPSTGAWAVAGGASVSWGVPGDVALSLPYAVRNAYFPPPAP